MHGELQTGEPVTLAIIGAGERGKASTSLVIVPYNDQPRLSNPPAYTPTLFSATLTTPRSLQSPNLVHKPVRCSRPHIMSPPRANYSLHPTVSSTTESQGLQWPLSFVFKIGCMPNSQSTLHDAAFMYSAKSPWVSMRMNVSKLLSKSTTRESSLL